jgi:hypothetical protein
MSEPSEYHADDDADNLLNRVIVGLRARDVPAFPHPNVAFPPNPAQQRQTVLTSLGGFHPRRKMIMRITSFSAVAAILLALGSTVLISLMSGASLAQVVQAVREHQFCRYAWVELNKNTDRLGPEIDEVTTKRTVYVDLQRDRFRTEMETEYNGAPYTFIDLQDLASGEQLMINPQQRKATLILRPKDENSLSFLQRLEKMQQDATTEHFKDKLDGRDTVGYRVVDAEKQTTVTIWVDPSTKLPVKITQDVPQFKIWYTMTGFEWDPEITAADRFFAIEVPAGFEKEVIDQREDAAE